jgi:hypothetical protein
MLKALQTGASPIFIQGKGRKKGKSTQFLTYKGSIPVYAPTLEELSIKYLNTVVPIVKKAETVPLATAQVPASQASNTNPAQENLPNTNPAKVNNKPRNTSRRAQIASALSRFSNPAIAKGIGSVGSSISERFKTRHNQLSKSFQENPGMTPVERRAAIADAARVAGQGAYAVGKVAGQGAYAVGKVAGQAATSAASKGYTLGKAGLGAAGRGARAAGVAGIIGAQAVGKSAYSGAKTLGKKASNAWSWMTATRKNTRSVNQNSNQSSLIAAANQANTGINTGTFGEPNQVSNTNTVEPTPNGLSPNAQAIANSIEATPENIETGKGRVGRKLAALRSRQARLAAADN